MPTFQSTSHITKKHLPKTPFTFCTKGMFMFFLSQNVIWNKSPFILVSQVYIIFFKSGFFGLPASTSLGC
jgi:hypothetical protein